MLRLLIRRFVREHERVEKPEVRRAYGMLCGFLGIFLNILLFAGKMLAGTLSGSIAVTADALNNLSDAGSSVISLLGFRLAAQKPHSDHPYGHGRYEYISGLVVSLAILLMGADLGKSSIEKMLHPEQIAFSWLSVCILAASIPVKLYMALYNRRIGRRIKSVAMAATATDSLSDMCTTALVLASTLVSRFTGINIDPYAGAAVSLLILRAGYGAARDTISPLLGKAPEPEFVERICKLVREYPEVVGMHDLMVHDYGAGRVMISLHAEVPASGDIMCLHDVIDTIERRLQEELHCMATIHMDPISTDDAQVCAVREQIEQRIHEELGRELSLHDFRMVTGPTHTNVIFDLVVPYEFQLSEREVKERVSVLVRGIEGSYFAVVTIDRPMAGMSAGA